MLVQYSQVYSLAPLAGAVVTHGTGSTVPAPTNLRATTTTSSSIALAWDSTAAAGSTYTLQRAPVSNGTAGAFTTVSPGPGTAKSYTDSPLTYLSTYDYRVLVTVNGVASAYSPTLRASTASGAQLTDYTPADAKWLDGKYKLPLAGGFIRNTYANARGTTTNATTLRLVIASSYGNFAPGQVINDYYGLLITPPGGANAFYKPTVVADSTGHAAADIALPAGAQIQLVAHDPARSAERTDGVYGSAIVQVLSDGVITWSDYVRPTRRLLAIGDSKTGGNAADEPIIHGTFFLGRGALEAAVFPMRTTVYSCSGASLSELYGPYATDKAANLAMIVAALDGTIENIFYIGYDGRNDAGRNTATAQQFGQYLQALITDVLAAGVVGLKIICQTAFPCTDIDAALDAYRAVTRSVAGGLSVHNLLEGPELLSVANVSNDKVHPNTAGQAEIATNTFAVIHAGAQFWNSEFNLPMVTNLLLGWGPATYDTNAFNGSGGFVYNSSVTGVTIAGGAAYLSGSNVLGTNLQLVDGATYTVSMLIISVTQGCRVELNGNAGAGPDSGQLNEYTLGGGTGSGPGTLSKTFVNSPNGTYPRSWGLSVTNGGSAVVGFVRIRPGN